jgi:hypothetical protein
MTEEIPLKDRKPMVKRNKKGQLEKGSILNPIGYVKGQRNFETDFNEVVEEIALANKITTSEARKILIKKAYAMAKDGNFQYHKDIHDRIYGQATNKTELKADVGFAEGFTPEEQTKLKSLLNGNRTSIRPDANGNSEGAQIPSK